MYKKVLGVLLLGIICVLPVQMTNAQKARVQDPNSNVSTTVSQPKKMLSQSEAEYMIDILIEYNNGNLPKSALKDAQPLFEARPDYLNYVRNDKLK